MNAFEEWLIDHPEYHPDDDRSEAFDAFAEQNNIPEDVTIWDYEARA